MEIQAPLASAGQRLGDNDLIFAIPPQENTPQLELGNDMALDAFGKIRNRSRPGWSAAGEPKAGSL